MGLCSGSFRNEQNRNQDQHSGSKGCLNSLKEIGLVREDSRNTWIRVSEKKRRGDDPCDTQYFDKNELTQENTVPSVTVQMSDKKTTTDRLAAIASSARILSAQLLTMAAEVESVALDAESEIHVIGQEIEKFKQFKQLLKGIGEA